MAIGTTAILAGASAAASIGQAISGISGTAKAKRDLKNFDRQALTNVYEDMPISLLGTNLAREENSRANSSYVEAARGGGIRGILGALPQLQAGNTNANRQMQLDLDGQLQKRNYAIAGDEQRIQGMQEQRDNTELAGIGQRIEANRQDTWSGIRGIANAFQYDQTNKGDEVDNAGTVTNDYGDILPTPDIFKRVFEKSFVRAKAVTELQPIGTMPKLTGSLMPSYLSTLKLQENNALMDEAVPKYW